METKSKSTSGRKPDGKCAGSRNVRSEMKEARFVDQFSPPFEKISL
jgi:hypothetical protein